MAIDSENKRASAANHFMFQIPPVPDGGLDTNADRAHLDVYCGITTAPLVPIVYTIPPIWAYYKRLRTY